MKWTGKVELSGRAAAQAVRNAASIIKQWGLTMPKVFPPLALDFGLGDFSRTGHIEYWIANENQIGYCGKFIFMTKGQTCPEHLHKRKNETFFIVRGKVLMRLKNRNLRMKPADVLPMATGTLHSFTALEDSLILEVSQPSFPKDSFFTDARIGVL